MNMPSDKFLELYSLIIIFVSYIYTMQEWFFKNLLTDHHGLRVFFMQLYTGADGENIV